MKVLIVTLSGIIGIAFTALIVNLLKSAVTFLIPALSGYPVVAFIMAIAILICGVLLMCKCIERSAVEYPYDDCM